VLVGEGNKGDKDIGSNAPVGGIEWGDEDSGNRGDVTGTTGMGLG
jgi:hypothetical protein